MTTERSGPVSENLPKIVVVGCGAWGKNHVRNHAELGSLAGVCDLNIDQAQKQAALFDVPVRGFDEVLADPSIDGVVLATPAAARTELAVAALNADKHVFVEKPFAVSTAAARRICSAAIVRRKTVMVGHLLHYHPAFEMVKDMVSQGRLGPLRYIYSHRMNLDVNRAEPDILWDYAPHDLSMILALTEQDPAQVTAVSSGLLAPGNNDITTVHMGFASGVRAHVTASCLHPYKEQKLVVIGERGMVVFNDTLPWADKLRLYPHSFDGEQAVRAEMVPVPLDEAEPLKLECRHFLDCIRSGRTPVTDGFEGIRVLAALEQIERALDSADVALPDMFGGIPNLKTVTA